MGGSLVDAKKRRHIGPLKDKQQLVKALEKTAGEEKAEKGQELSGRDGKERRKEGI
jgi:hypothetical protein